ncbi:MAG: carbohydrate porin [Rhodoplanes sp.]|uniref:carbohydrate porin n=1 Tax=Rhodoplanes sp. TaxID=1968906 RepID=UPI0017DA51F0|nr:carbohydrate porin [Rhodoplanes sp.]NVO17387.1 carbohydrate porin [Rhodoplanes sp.]
MSATRLIAAGARARSHRSARLGRGSGFTAPLVAGLASLLTSVSPLAAADLAADVWNGAVARYDWSGAYFGGHLGYGRGDTHSTLRDPDPTIFATPFGSLYAGFQGGYNVVLPSRLMLGVEVDATFPNFLEDGFAANRTNAQGTQFIEQVDYIATVRGRVGYAFDRWMLYGTGGFLVSQARLTENPGVAAPVDKLTPTRTGWAAGIGAEFAVTKDWSARLEYLYDHIGGVQAAFPSGDVYDSSINMHMLRVGINRSLRWGDSPSGWAPASKAEPIGKDWNVGENWNIHGQFTAIGQAYPSFRSPYEGTNSLTGSRQFKNTVSATAFLGVRPWEGTEIYLNPELMQGSGLSDTYGLGAYSNGEAQKSGFPMPRANIARVFVRQTFGLGGEQETVEDGPNQLAGKRDVSRITVTAGKMSVIDLFDANSFSHDPRVDFMNWNMYCCGSYDLTMDKVGYTWGAAAELNQKRWAFRVGYFLLPAVSNVNNFDVHMPDQGQYLAELELRYSLFDQPGKLRFLGYLNRGMLGSYAEATAIALQTGMPADIVATRAVRNNYGFVVNAEQAITDDLGVMARASWGAGQTEKMGWTDSDESIMVGGVLKGTSWGRPNDKIGLGGVIDGLSPEGRAFFAAGGMGILIGDGMLNYRTERVLETYYSYNLSPGMALTFDYQFVVNPAYNADRGPVSLFAARLHGEF